MLLDNQVLGTREGNDVMQQTSVHRQQESPLSAYGFIRWQSIQGYTPYVHTCTCAYFFTRICMIIILETVAGLHCIPRGWLTPSLSRRECFPGNSSMRTAWLAWLAEAELVLIQCLLASKKIRQVALTEWACELGRGSDEEGGAVTQSRNVTCPTYSA